MNSIDFVSCFSLLQQTWLGDPVSLQALFMKGMVKFYITYSSVFDENRFKKALSKVTAKELKKEVNKKDNKEDVDMKYAKVFCEYYNKGLKDKNKKLKFSKLED